MLYRLGLAKEIISEYGFNALPIFWNTLQKKTLPIQIDNEVFFQNYDKSSFYHLVNSFPKVKRLAELIPPEPNGVIIDGGANNGLFSFHVAKRFPSTKIYAFEPYPLLVPILKKNLTMSNVQLVHKALTKSDGEISLFVSDDSDQIGSTHRENVSIFGTIKDEIKVESISLNSFVKQENIEKISVLKLDVQGAELDILKGASEIIPLIESLILEITLAEKSAFELIEIVRAHFPYHKVINPVGYGADILFSKQKLE